MRAGIEPLREFDAATGMKYQGLSDAQAPAFEERIQAYKAGDPNAGAEIVGIVAAAARDRPDLVGPLLRNIEEFGGPELYKKARAAVPRDSDVDKQVSQGETRRVGAAVQAQDVFMMKNMVIDTMSFDGKVTDQAGRAELARIAGTPDHPQQELAKKALMEITQRSGNIKSLPKGSVFGGGR
jgi:hypothetical protein